MIKAKSIFLLSFLFLILLLAMNPADLKAIDQSNPSPYLPYSGYLGGSNSDYGRVAAIDKDGNSYIAGYTNSFFDFPITFGTFKGDFDVFIAKFDPEDNLIWCACFGGSSGEKVKAIAIDETGDIYITGITWSSDWSSDFPVIFGTYSGNGDGFIAKLDSQGNPIWFRYLGGSNMDAGEAMVLGKTGDIYIAGTTRSSIWSSDFPVIFDVYSGDIDVFITKFDSQGNPIWLRYLGGSDYDLSHGIALDEAENVYVVGDTGSSDFPDTYDKGYAGLCDIFVIKLDSYGYLIWSIYVGGTNLDTGRGIVVDEDGNIYVVGFNLGGNFPVSGNAFDRFYNGHYDVIMFKLNSEGTSLWATYVGESEDDSAFAIVLDNDGNPYVAGITNSSNLLSGLVPYVLGYSGGFDVFLIKFNSEGVVVSFTYLGGSYNDALKEGGLAINGSVSFRLTGYTESDDFPVVGNAVNGSYKGQRDAFVSKILAPPVVNLTISTTIRGTTNPNPGTYTYDFGPRVQIQAVPDSGYVFNGWTGSVSEGDENDNPITILMDSDKSITAHFTAILDEPDEPDNCFIATAAYGTPLHSDIDALRDFRDKYLMTNKLGRKLVEFYYKYSPFLADLISKNKILKNIVRNILSPLAALIEVLN